MLYSIAREYATGPRAPTPRAKIACEKNAQDRHARALPCKNHPQPKHHPLLLHVLTPTRLRDRVSTMRILFTVLEVASGTLLVVAVLLQQRGSGIGMAFGGGGHLYSVRRGAERVLFIGTTVLAVAFFASALGLTLLGR